MYFIQNAAIYYMIMSQEGQNRILVNLKRYELISSHNLLALRYQLLTIR